MLNHLNIITDSADHPQKGVKACKRRCPMSKKRRHYTEEFKESAVKLVTEQGSIHYPRPLATSVRMSVFYDGGRTPWKQVTTSHPS